MQPKIILFSGDTLNKPPEIQNTSTLAILQRIWIWILAVFLTYMVCLSVFPSITAQVESTGTGVWSTTYFIPVGCFLLFNIGDFAGRMLASFIQWPKANHMGSLIGMVYNKMSIVTIFGFKHFKKNFIHLLDIFRHFIIFGIKLQYYFVALFLQKL